MGHIQLFMHATPLYQTIHVGHIQLFMQAMSPHQPTTWLLAIDATQWIDDALHSVLEIELQNWFQMGGIVNVKLHWFIQLFIK